MKKTSDKQNTPHPVDVHIGHRLRLARNMAGLSQDKLAEELGITFQQVQKYERGDNRVSGSRIYRLARILKVSELFFFAEYEDSGNPFDTTLLADCITKHEIDFLKTFRQFTPKQKTIIKELMKAMAKNNTH